MPKPVKIKKKKSFMFTTKHHSFLGVLGGVVAVISVVSLVGSTYLSYINRGSTPVKLGGVGLFAACLNVIGLISGMISLNERDIHKWLPIAAMVGNGLILLLWVFYLAMGIRGI